MIRGEWDYWGFIRGPEMNRFPHIQVLSDVVSRSVTVKDYVNRAIRGRETAAE